MRAKLRFKAVHMYPYPMSLTTMSAGVMMIPDDILVEVFVLCLPQNVTIPASHIPRPSFVKPSPAQAPLLLCRICHRWKVVATATPRLWSSLNTESVRDPRIVQLWLERSGQAPLSLALAPFSQHVSIPMHLHLPLLLPNILRCRNLEVREWFASGAMQPRIPASGLRLERVAVAINRRDTRAALWFSQLLMAAAVLTQMHWVGPSVIAPWAQLVYLSLTPWNPTDLLQILPQLVNLIDLHLICPGSAGLLDEPDFYNTFTIPPTGPCVLPSVTTFSLHWFPGLITFLTLPNLRNLIVSGSVSPQTISTH